MRKNNYSEELPSSTSKRKERERQTTSTIVKHGTASSSSAQRPSTASNCYSYRNERGKHSSKIAKPVKQAVANVEVTNSERVDVSKLSNELTKMILQTTSPNFVVKRSFDTHSLNKNERATVNSSSKKATSLNDAQTLQIKKILAECLQNFESSDSESTTKRSDPTRKHHYYHHLHKTGSENNLPFAPISAPDTHGKTSLLRSYLSGSNPAREEYVSKKKNVSNSLISSDSVHHSIFLESGRERRQCLLQYLSNVVADGQVVIYVNSIPGVESLMNFLTKHGFQVNAVHQRMMMAESNWILSEFSLKKFAVLLCAEDHYHSCPAHFRWVKTIINYELPICNPVENWTIRNGIVEFSDNLPVHIYTFIKKTCPLDYEMVKLLHLDAVDQEEEMIQQMSEQVYSLQ